MGRIRISGGRTLEGTVRISGSKNAALPLMVAGLLTSEPLTLCNVPELVDISLLASILGELGVQVRIRDCLDQSGVQGRCYTLHTREITNTTAPFNLVSRMRASFWVVGPLLARCGQARVALPGGCAIGRRPVDLYLSALEQLGARIVLSDGYVVVTAERGLIGTKIRFPGVTVGATHTLMMAATLARGETIIENAACEPEVVELGRCLIAMGAQITGLGTHRIVIEGVNRLHGTQCVVSSDRIETGTYAFAVIGAGGDVLLEGGSHDNLTAVLEIVRRAGGEVKCEEAGIRVQRERSAIFPVKVQTAPFPGFPTDLQAQLMAAMIIAEGRSVIRETIFENRFMHVHELMKLGANIRLEGDKAIIEGVSRLQGAAVMATDLRASAGLVIGGLIAEGTTTIDRVSHLDRGFENIERKLRGLGAEIERLSD